MQVDKYSSWISGFSNDYEELFVKDWSPYMGAILLALIIIGLMISGLFWGVFSGIKLWGDWFNNFIGLGSLVGISENLDSPLMHRISIMDITLVLGAFSAALLSRKFSINKPPKLEYLWAAVGGTLMGIGANLAGGCTVGGFFTPLMHISPAGWVMAIGLIIGAVIGLKMLLWTLENIEWGMVPPKPFKIPQNVVTLYPLLGVIVFALIILWTVQWFSADNERLNNRALLVLGGFAIGFILHRSRLCFARAFREPVMTGEGEMTKAIILAIAIGTPLTALLFQQKILDPYVAIPATFWLGSLLGGICFGIGMVFAGGCANGALWRMGEGHLKLWVAVFFFAWSGSIAGALFRKTGWLTTEMNFDLIEESQVGFQAYLPVMLDSWGWTITITSMMLIIWYALVRYNESTEKFTLF